MRIPKTKVPQTYIETKFPQIIFIMSPKKLSGNLEGIADRPLDRFTKRAGVLRTSPSCFSTMKGYIGEIVRAIISRAVIVTRNNQRRTISSQDVSAAFEMLGICMAASVTNSTTSFRSCTSAAKSAPPKRKAEGEKTKPYRHRPGAKAQRMVKYQQKNSDCFSIPKRNFERVVREITQDYGEFRFAESEGVIDLIQLFVENFLVELCQSAAMCAGHAGRATLYDKDLVLVTSIKKWPFKSAVFQA